MKILPFVSSSNFLKFLIFLVIIMITFQKDFHNMKFSTRTRLVVVTDTVRVSPTQQIDPYVAILWTNKHWIFIDNMSHRHDHIHL